MKNENKFIIKLHNKCYQEGSSLRKYIGLLDPKNMCLLIDRLGLEANPRLAKTGRVIDDIIDTLENSPELFMYKSKGILLSTSNCDELDRGRLRLTFSEDEIEGILDGGHNTLAIAKYLISCVNEDEAKKVRTWDDLSNVWDDFKDEIESDLQKEDSAINNFLVPIEIITPLDEKNGFFTENIFEISSARNNNAELTHTARANHAGYYDKLAEKLDPEIQNDIEWKTNEPNKRIKAQDIVSLSLIPIIFLQKNHKLPDDISNILEVSLYNSKSKCVNDFTKIMTHPKIGLTGEKKEKVIQNTLIDSALDMMYDIPKLYDYIYEYFPTAYNDHSGRFGGIGCVKMYNETEKGEKYTSRKVSTKFYNKKIDYKYPDGFIYPIIVSMHALMELQEERIQWKTDPFIFLEKNLSKIIATYVSLIKTNNWDPQKVGKDITSYQVIEIMINMEMMLKK